VKFFLISPSLPSNEHVDLIYYRLPLDVYLQTLVDGKAVMVPVVDLLAGRKVVIVGVPACFTKPCKKHIQGFKALHSEFMQHCSMIICVSVTDPFVADAWKEDLEYPEVVMLSDGNARFAKTLGLEMETGSFGGLRLNRFSMVVDDGVVKALNVERGGDLTEVSSAESLLRILEEDNLD